MAIRMTHEVTYFFKPACQFSTTVYGSFRVTVVSVRKLLPSAAESHKLPRSGHAGGMGRAIPRGGAFRPETPDGSQFRQPSPSHRSENGNRVPGHLRASAVEGQDDRRLSTCHQSPWASRPMLQKMTAK